MIKFCKSDACPTSEELLAFRRERVAAEKASEIRAHNRSCDFCSAELEFYFHFSAYGDEKIPVAVIPSSLYELAESLLNNKNGEVASLNRLLSSRKGVNTSAR